MFSSPLLAIRAKKARLRHLDQAQRKRLVKLQILRLKLLAGETVQNRDLETWLSADEFEAMQRNWHQVQQHHDLKLDKPDEIHAYEEMLKRADFFSNRADGYSAKGRKETAARMRQEADSAYEAALEYITEHCSTDPSLNSWLDREVNLDPDSNLSLSPAGMPRVRTSRSHNKLAAVTKTSIRDNKLGAVESAIFDLMYE